MSDADDVIDFRAPSRRRIAATVGIALLVVLIIPILLVYTWRASIAAVFFLLITGQLWWAVLRPRLRADRAGLEIRSGRQPERVAWTDIQRSEVGPSGTLIVVKGGREILSRVPFGLRSEQVPKKKAAAGAAAEDSSGSTETEADRVAIFLAARTAWARRRDNSPPPKYVPVS